MRAVVQRVIKASVRAEGYGEEIINKGLVCFVGFGREDQGQELERSMRKLAQKIINLRVFSKDDGRFDLSLCDIQGEIMLIPQFTLYGDIRRGRRPDFFSAMASCEARHCFDRFCQIMREYTDRIKAGFFGAHMIIDLINDGPVTIYIDTKDL